VSTVSVTYFWERPPERWGSCSGREIAEMARWQREETNFKGHIERVICVGILWYRSGRGRSTLRPSPTDRKRTPIHFPKHLFTPYRDSRVPSVECRCIWGGGERLGSHRGLISCPGMDELMWPDMSHGTAPLHLLCYLYSSTGDFIPASSAQYTRAEMNTLVAEVAIRTLVCTLEDSHLDIDKP